MYNGELLADPLLNEIRSIVSVFNTIPFHHVYRERNDNVDGLSKVWLQLVHRDWIIQNENGQSSE
jgi:hypothetical protein